VKIILTQDVPNLGHIGDVEEVADGYARNYLIPEGMAVKATAGAIKEYKRRQAAEERRSAERRAEAQELAEVLKSVTLSFEAKAGETGRLYGSITPDDIAQALERETGQTFDRRKQLSIDPLREVGEHTITVQLEEEIEAEVKVVIEPEDGEMPTEDTTEEDAAE